MPAVSDGQLAIRMQQGLLVRTRFVLLVLVLLSEVLHVTPFSDHKP
jgi:hypothetical protein